MQEFEACLSDIQNPVRNTKTKEKQNQLSHLWLKDLQLPNSRGFSGAVLAVVDEDSFGLYFRGCSPMWLVRVGDFYEIIFQLLVEADPITSLQNSGLYVRRWT